MKIILVIFISLILMQIQAYAESIQVGCAVKTYDCLTLPDGTTKCSWGYDLGSVQDVSLSKTGTGTNYEIWEGKVSRVIRGKYPYELSILQRREPNNKVNFLTLKLIVGDIESSGMGQNIFELGHISKVNSFGIGLRCTTDLVPGALI